MTSFLNYLKEVFIESLPEDAFFKNLREKAWVQCSLPDKTHEAFQYVPLRELYVKSYPRSVIFSDEAMIASYIYPECQKSYLVFINGHYHPLLSKVPEGVVVDSLPDSLLSYGHFLKQRLSKILTEETDPFALLNMALHASGAFIYFPPKFTLSTPIEIINLFTGPSFPRFQLFLGAQAEIHLISKSVSLTELPFWSSSLMDISIEEGASFHHVDKIDMPSENWHFQAVRASLKADSRYHSISFTKGAKSIRQDYKVALLGENASADLQGLSLLSGSHQAHTHVLMQHLAPHCHSMQSFKNVLYDNSQSSFQGQIYVDQKAQKTQAYQINNNLVLGAGAIANSKPNLRIFADDVKASHGSTVGQLDPQALFYLRTRGFTEAEAKEFLVMGFCKELVDQIPYASVRELCK